jgi:hypothetical protein
MITKISAEGRTCTVHTSATGSVCGAPATLAFRSSLGEIFAECAEHELPLPTSTPPVALAARSPRRIKCSECGHVHTFGPCGVRVGPGRREACSCTRY